MITKESMIALTQNYIDIPNNIDDIEFCRMDEIPVLIMTTNTGDAFKKDKKCVVRVELHNDDNGYRLYISGKEYGDLENSWTKTEYPFMAEIMEAAT